MAGDKPGRPIPHAPKHEKTFQLIFRFSVLWSALFNKIKKKKKCLKTALLKNWNTFLLSQRIVDSLLT